MSIKTVNYQLNTTPMPTREDLTQKILDEKRSRGLTWKEIALAIGPGSPILYTAALLGQMTLTKDEAANAAKMLHLSEMEAAILTEPPYRGSLATVPTHGSLDLSLL